MRNRLWMVILVLALSLAACSQGSNQSSDSNSTSKKGNNKVKYHRIVSLMPSNTEILYRLGLGITLLVYQRLMITLKMLKR